MGLFPGLAQEGYVVERLKSLTGPGWMTSSLPVGVFREITGGKYITVQRSVLSSHLYAACAGIESRFSCSIAAVEPGEKGRVSARFDNGVRETFDLLVGADGLHSTTRRLVFGPQERYERSLGLHVAALVLEGYRPRDEATYVQYTRPNRQISRLSLRDDKTLILFVFNDALFEGDPDGDVMGKAALRAVYADMGWESDAILARLDEAESLYLDRVSQIEMPHWTNGRVALVGDAAGCISLLGGEGTGLAMTEAYVLAGELHRAAGDYSAAFAAYESRLKAYVTRKQVAARRLTGFFAPRSWFGLVLREVATNLASIPFLTRRLVGAGMTEEIDLPDYG